MHFDTMFFQRISPRFYCSSLHTVSTSIKHQAKASKTDEKRCVFINNNHVETPKNWWNYVCLFHVSGKYVLKKSQDLKTS